ncbi:MazG nucleotide pyrophosphohydrolase domain-containing protein [Nocardioides sp. R1-1]|uniref:MazG nucleotide pyrophosphohydrolase domain-containing protein n=1 Tax=Nocardioides sp. R1-1 TaxID=3383502 RepID=UPI0038D194EC
MADDAVAEFVAVMRRLRAECPWKQEQTHRSLVRYLIEEAYETVDAIDDAETSGDYGHLAEELGDLLLQVVFHAVIAEERGDFGLDDVARGITAKMRRRNPHVFGGEVGEEGLTAAQVDERWQRIKAGERGGASTVDELPSALPALLYADKALARRERAGLTTPPPSGPGQDIGERLLGLVAEARASGTDPEQALRDAVRRLPGRDSPA